MEQKTGFKEMFLRLVAIVGLIAVLILGAWGIILLAFNVVGFFNGTGSSLGSLFSHDNTPAITATTTDITVPPATVVTTVTPPVSKPTTTNTARPTAVYTAAAQRAPLYGLPDLAVTVTSVTSLSSVQGRMVVQFVVSNIGTNVALSGWTFNAKLPLSPSYTYQSSAQQALYPGDKIAYTLTYDDPNFRNNYNNQNGNQNQVCSQQYPYTCTYNYNNQYQYQQYPSNQTCYTYNGYQNVPGPCYQYDQDSNPYNPNYNYYNTNSNSYYGNNQNYYNNNSGYYPYGGTVVVTVDPQNWVPELLEYNNSASKSY